MHPWTMQRLAEERCHEVLLAAARERAGLEARRVGSAGPSLTTRRPTRYLGELLIRTGWRLVGTDTPASGVRTRLALRGSVSATVDPC